MGDGERATIEDMQRRREQLITYFQQAHAPGDQDSQTVITLLKERFAKDQARLDAPVAAD